MLLAGEREHLVPNRVVVPPFHHKALLSGFGMVTQSAIGEAIAPRLIDHVNDAADVDHPDAEPADDNRDHAAHRDRR